MCVYEPGSNWQKNQTHLSLAPIGLSACLSSMRIKTPPEPQLLVFGWACWTLRKLTSSSSRTLSSTKMPCLFSRVSDFLTTKSSWFRQTFLGIFWFQILYFQLLLSGWQKKHLQNQKKHTTFYLATFGVWLEDAGKLKKNWIPPVPVHKGNHLESQ